MNSKESLIEKLTAARNVAAKNAEMNGGDQMFNQGRLCGINDCIAIIRQHADRFNTEPVQTTMEDVRSPSVKDSHSGHGEELRGSNPASSASQCIQTSPVCNDSVEQSVLNIFHKLFPWFTNEAPVKSTDFVSAIRPYLRTTEPVSVDHRKIGCLIHDTIDVTKQKHENVIAIYDAIKPYLMVEQAEQIFADMAQMPPSPYDGMIGNLVLAYKEVMRENARLKHAVRMLAYDGLSPKQRRHIASDILISHPNKDQ